MLYCPLFSLQRFPRPEDPHLHSQHVLHPTGEAGGYGESSGDRGFESILTLQLAMVVCLNNNPALISHPDYNCGIRSLSFIVTTCPL